VIETDRNGGTAGDEDWLDRRDAAIEEIYDVFGRFRLAAHVEGCPHCVSDHDHARIHAAPLRSLTAHDLHRYAWKAMTTWGDINDFKHFLPRLLELAVGNGSDWVDVELLLGKLGRAGFVHWPAAERRPVETFLWSTWNVGLAQDASAFDVDAWLCGVAGTGVDATPYIEAFRNNDAPTAIGHIAAFLDHNPELLTRGKLSNAWWNESVADASARELRNWLAACMADEQFQARLATAYEQLG